MISQLFEMLIDCLDQFFFFFKDCYFQSLIWSFEEKCLVFQIALNELVCDDILICIFDMKMVLNDFKCKSA